MRRGHGDLAIGLFVVALAAGYWEIARTTRDSFLTDNVGVGGFPTMIAGALALTGAVLMVHGIMRPGSAVGAVDWPAHAHALAVLVMLAVFVLLMPVLGYPAALALLIAGSAAYAGARGPGTLLVTSVVGGLLFWLTFAKLFGIPMPLGAWKEFLPLLDD